MPVKGFGKVNVSGAAKKATGPKMDLSAITKKPTGIGKIDMGAIGKKTPFGKKGFGALAKKGQSGNDGEAHGLLEGISSLHSWIKSQTMMKPGKKMMGIKIEPAYDPVFISFIVIIDFDSYLIFNKNFFMVMSFYF